MLALSGLREGFARGWACLRTACPERGRRARLPVPKIPAAKSRIPITSKLIEIKRLQVLYSGYLRKTGGRGVLALPIFALQCPAFLPASSALFTLSVPSACPERSRTLVKSPLCSTCCGLLAASLPLTSFFPHLTELPLVSLLLPLLTQKQGGVPPPKNVGAPTFLIFPLIFRTFLPLTGPQQNRGEEVRRSHKCSLGGRGFSPDVKGIKNVGF